MTVPPKRIVGRYPKNPTRNSDLEIKDPSRQQGLMPLRWRSETEGLVVPLFRALAPRDEIPDRPSAGSWPVYSRRLADVLGEHAVCAPAHVTFGRRKEKSAFCLCVPKVTIAGLDEGLTLWKENPFQPDKMTVDKPVLRRDIDWPPFFRVERIPNYAFVNEAMAATIESLGFTGIGFEPLPNVLRKLTAVESEAWLSSVQDAMGDLGCATCLGYLDDISKSADVHVFHDGDAGVQQKAGFYRLDVHLRPTSPLFQNVFHADGSASHGRYRGQCQSCSRQFRYDFHSTSRTPDRLQLGMRTGGDKTQTVQSASAVQVVPQRVRSIATTTSGPNKVRLSREQEGPAWLSSLLETVGGLECDTCLGYLDGISKFAHIFGPGDGVAYVLREGEFFLLDIHLHASSPIFPDVFNATGYRGGGRYKGRCRGCGRQYRWEYEPKDAAPGRFRMGCRSEPEHIPPPKPAATSVPPTSAGPRPAPPRKRPPPRPLPPLATEDVVQVGTENAGDFSQANADAHEHALLGPPPGSNWATQIEHRWTARLGVTAASIWEFIITPQTVWLEVHSRPAMTLESDVYGLDKKTAEVSFHARGKHLTAANAHIALLRSKSKPKGFLGVANGRGTALWHSQYPANHMSLTPSAVVASADFSENLVIATNPLNEAPTNWEDLSAQSAWHVRKIYSRRGFWVVEYRGGERRLEVRRACDNTVIWQREPGDDGVYVHADGHGWLAGMGGFDGKVESYDSNGELLATWQTREVLHSLGPRFCVGRLPLAEGGIWGAPEPPLRVTDRRTGESRALPQDLFPNRTCFIVSGDVLWCVCENQRVLRAYDLVSRKVVREISPLPSGPHSTHRSNKIQSMAAYGTDLYITSKAGLILAFG